MSFSSPGFIISFRLLGLSLAPILICGLCFCPPSFRLSRATIYHHSILFFSSFHFISNFFLHTHHLVRLSPLNLDLQYMFYQGSDPPRYDGFQYHTLHVSFLLSLLLQPDFDFAVSCLVCLFLFWFIRGATRSQVRGGMAS